MTRFSSTAGVRVDRVDREILDEWRREYSLSELRARGMLDAPGRGARVSRSFVASDQRTASSTWRTTARRTDSS